jgi:hypothetical protein
MLVSVLAAISLVPATAAARRAGIAAEGCGGCHQGGQEPGVRLLAAPANPAPGQKVAITVEIDAVNGSVGGFYVRLEGAGSMQAPAGSGIRAFNPDQLGHSTPKAASGGVVRFTFDYTAPSTPGGAIFRAYVVSGDGNDRSSGDAGAEGELLLAYGCSGELYAIDPDGDGYGSAELGQKRDCSLPAGYSQLTGDCAEYDPLIHPEAAELCNDKDEDCDGQLDEGLPQGPQYPDGDGDGHGDLASSESIVDCSSPKGYAAVRDDCDDEEPDVHPEADEACNFADDDCDGRSDENARAACGVGWCRRLADSCDLDLCSPGKPRAEECNAFDDDCDDVIDNGVRCPGDQVCSEGRCVPPDAIGGDAGTGAMGAAGATAGATAGNSAAGTGTGTGTGGSGVTGSSGAAGGSRDDCAADANAGGDGCMKDVATESSKSGCSALPRSPSRVTHGAWLALLLAGWLARRRQRQRARCAFEQVHAIGDRR